MSPSVGRIVCVGHVCWAPPASSQWHLQAFLLEVLILPKHGGPHLPDSAFFTSGLDSGSHRQAAGQEILFIKLRFALSSPLQMDGVLLMCCYRVPTFLRCLRVGLRFF